MVEQSNSLDIYPENIRRCFDEWHMHFLMHLDHQRNTMQQLLTFLLKMYCQCRHKLMNQEKMLCKVITLLHQVFQGPTVCGVQYQTKNFIK